MFESLVTVSFLVLSFIGWHMRDNYKGNHYPVFLSGIAFVLIYFRFAAGHLAKALFGPSIVLMLDAGIAVLFAVVVVLFVGKVFEIALNSDP